jgi:hypothetical protein
MAEFYDVIEYSSRNNRILPVSKFRINKSDIIFRIGDQYMDRKYNFYLIENDNKLTLFNFNRYIKFMLFLLVTFISSSYKLYTNRYIYKNNKEIEIFLLLVVILSSFLFVIFSCVFIIGSKYFMCEIYDKKIKNCFHNMFQFMIYTIGLSFILVLFFI